MLLIRAKVGISNIHGFGLIAQEFIPKGTVTWRLVPGFDCLFAEEELGSFPRAVQDQVHHYGHYDPDLGKYVLCSDDARFTNHSAEPTELSYGDHSIAARDILPGEEITCDYGDFVHRFQVLQDVHEAGSPSSRHSSPALTRTSTDGCRCPRTLCVCT